MGESPLESLEDAFGVERVEVRELTLSGPQEA